MKTKISRKKICTLFNNIAHKYDLLNKLLSFGIDNSWRKKVLKLIPLKKEMHILDVATGTGDLALMLAQNLCSKIKITGIDISDKMIEIGLRKVKKNNLSKLIDLQLGDARKLKFSDSTFDVVTVAFGLRNMVNTKKTLAEMMRVLKPGGCLIILEFSIPTNRLFKLVYLFYFRLFVPLIGGLISGNYNAYRYLNESVENFDSSILFNMKKIPISFGIATIYVTHKLA
jgi:demethylmenaquinone methyltransferase/2-methoxy-6-polyprenyl-1,4-benzoquinol methylase